MRNYHQQPANTKLMYSSNKSIQLMIAQLLGMGLFSKWEGLGFSSLWWPGAGSQSTHTIENFMMPFQMCRFPHDPQVPSQLTQVIVELENSAHRFEKSKVRVGFKLKPTCLIGELLTVKQPRFNLVKTSTILNYWRCTVLAFYPSVLPMPCRMFRGFSCLVLALPLCFLGYFCQVLY